MNVRNGIPPSEHRREASAWQGGIRPRYPETRIEHAQVDLALNAWLAG